MKGISLLHRDGRNNLLGYEIWGYLLTNYSPKLSEEMYWARVIAIWLRVISLNCMQFSLMLKEMLKLHEV